MDILIIHGGRYVPDVPVFGDLWTYNFTESRFREITQRFCDGADWPEDGLARQAHLGVVLTNGRVSDSLYINAGKDKDSKFLTDTWRLSLTDWCWTLIPPGATNPSGRERADFDTLDAGRKIIMHGGQNTNGKLDDTWIFSHIDMSWTALNTSGEIPVSFFSSTFLFLSLLFVERQPLLIV